VETSNRVRGLTQ